VPRTGWLIAEPLWLLVTLDLSAVALGTAAVAQLGDPDILLHVVWIVLAVGAFTFGLRVAAARTLAASVFVMAYAVTANGAANPTAAAMADLDLEEWPLMAVIACIVAIMADRVTSTGRRYAALYRAASDRLLTAQEDERRRLAVDLHDGVGQTLTALVLMLDAAEDEAQAEAPGEGGFRIRRAREIAGIALEETRGVAFRLRPARLREGGLVAALGELAASAGVQVEFEAEPSLVRPGLLDADREVDTYRIVQEALGNATRHSRAQRIGVTANRVGSMLRLEVADDGDGFDPLSVAGHGLGLASMHERASAVRGTLLVQSRPHGGTLVRLDVPLAAGWTTEPPTDRTDPALAAASAQ
jgi:signal transduction histidine kinase